MPNNVQGVNFFAGANPGLYAQQQNLNAQQAIAQQMMQQGTEPLNPTRTAGRFVVPISPLEGAAHAGKAIAAAMMQKNINSQQSQLAQQQTQALLGLLRGGGQQAPQQSQPTQVAQGPVGVSDVSAGALGAPWAAASQTPQPPPQPQAPQQQGGGNPMSLTGDPQKDMALIMAGQMFGPEYGKELMSRYAPTDLVKNIEAAGYQQGSRQAQAAFGHALNPPMNVRPGGTVYQPGAGPQYIAPNLPQGSTPIQPNNPQAGVQPIPGAAQVASTMAGAGAAGRAPYEFREVPSPTGAPQVRSIASLAAGEGTQPPGAPAQPSAPQGGGPAPAPATGQSTYGKSFAEQAAKDSNEYVNELRHGARDSVEQNRMLNQLEQNIGEFTPGKAAAIRKSIAQWRVQMGIADDETKKIAASAEEGDKLVGQLVSNALKKLSARPTQMEFQIFKDQYVPNMAMTPQGAQQVIQFMRQQNNLSAQKYQKFNDWRKQQAPDTDLRDFDLHWNPQAAQAPLGATQSFPNTGAGQTQGVGAKPQPLSPQEQQELQQLRARFGR